MLPITGNEFPSFPFTLFPVAAVERNEVNLHALTQIICQVLLSLRVYRNQIGIYTHVHVYRTYLEEGQELLVINSAR
jgi:hypothetical protein